MLIFGGLAQLLAFPLVGLAENICGVWPWAFYVLGLFNGTTEAAMGTQAILVERAAGRPRLSSLHALYSFGGLIGSLGGALLAGFTPLTHFCLVAVPALCPPALCRVAPAARHARAGAEKRGFRAPPLPLLLLGFMALCCYAAEGTVGDWGALLLHQFKGASDRTAALAYAAYLPPPWPYAVCSEIDCGRHTAIMRSCAAWPWSPPRAFCWRFSRPGRPPAWPGTP